MLASWLFLGVSLWGAAFTVNALWPQRGMVVQVVLSFFNAWLTTELALHHILWQAVCSAIFVWYGALDAWPGWLGAGITLLSWAGLAHLFLEGHRDGEVVGEALVEALGEDYLAGIDVAHRRHMRPTIEWRRLVWPFRQHREEVMRLTNVPYTETGRRRHRLDIYKRRDLARGAPVLLQIHGGAWMIGDKSNQGLPLMYHLAERGWLVVAINYALSPRATWPEHLIDCKRALAWIRENAEEHGGDPDFVVVTGGSAGGHLAAMVALTANDPELQPGFEEVDTQVAAFIPFYGVFDWTNRFDQRGKRDALKDRLERFIVKASRDSHPEIYDRASPMSHVKGSIPPAMVLHGRKDNLAPVEEAQQFVTQLREVSEEPVVYVEFAGAHHAFDLFPSVRALHAIHGVEAFAAWVASQRRGPRKTS
ncbi:MAG: alpha/beta hydrolase [Polyangiaceae bacterium]